MTYGKPEAWLGELHGVQAVWLRAGCYEAALLPELGGNLVAWRDLDKGYRLLHEPTGAAEMERMKEKPTHYGFPVLFPPNRLEDGEFPWNGNVYHFPINNPDKNNHSHGFLLREPWKVHSYGTERTGSYAAVEARVDERHPAYAYFPHAFTIRITYTLHPEGLTQRVTVTNQGADPMPVLLGFHTSVNAPFSPGSAASDYSFTLNADKRIEMNDRMLPTGRLLELAAWEESMLGEGMDPFDAPLDHHYTVGPRNAGGRMELTDHKEKVVLVYETDPAYGHWMLFNNGAREGYFCPEPQTCRVNAPNLDLPREDTGIIGLAPGGIWEAESRMYILSSHPNNRL
jgi:aldose 1-epimerase